MSENGEDYSNSGTHVEDELHSVRTEGEREGGGEGEGRKKTKKSKKKAKIAVMEESGQTDAERRRLRHDLRNLNKTMEESVEQMENVRGSKFAEMRAKNNALFQQVRYTRESVLEGENLELIANRAAKQIEKLVQVPRYDAVRFTRALHEKFALRNGALDWSGFGLACGTCFNAVPASVQFFKGAIDAGHTPKNRKMPVRRKPVEEEEEEEEEERRPDESKKQEENSGDRLSAVERNITEVTSVLARRVRAKKQRDEAMLEALSQEERSKKRIRIGEIDAVPYMFNPKSFTQTVENLFHFSFLVKKGTASIKVREDGCPKVCMVQAEDHPKPRQAILSLNMKQWREMCESYSVEKSQIPHRTNSQYARR